MAVELVIEPGRVVTWEHFVEESATREVGSIALDGYVFGRPQYGRVANHLGALVGVKNFNHHEEVDRLATYATCGQVEIALVSDFDEGFHDERGRFAADVFVNDSDQDVCLAVWLLRNKHLVEAGDNPNIGRLVRVANLMDMTAGSYKFNKDLPFLETLNWINGPYNRARLSGEITSPDPDVHLRIIDEVGSRIDRYIMGAAGVEPLDYDFDPVDKNHNWIMIREKGAQGKKGAIDQGNNVIITIRDQDPERVHVSFWRRADWTRCDFPALIAALNDAELARLKELGLVDSQLEALDANNGWGGGTTTFGSPRSPGTKLSKEEIGTITDAHSYV